MTTWGDAHTRGAAMAAELHADLDIDRDQPVDVFGAIEQLGVVLAFAPLGRVSGLYLPADGSPGILLHQGHPRTRQRYTAGHELGHHVFGHAAEVDGDLEQALQRGDLERWSGPEKEAEAFGAWFLMPRRLIRRGMTQLGIEKPESPIDVYALSLWLGTSYTATARHLGTTRIVDDSVARAWVQIPPRVFKESLAGTFIPRDLKNDVWWLDARHNHQAIEARPGDRLVLTLDEIPSSGFSWRIAYLPTDVRLVADSFEIDWEPELTLGKCVDSGPIVASPDDGPVAGAGHPRSLILEIDQNAGREVERLVLVKDQPWEPGRAADQFDLQISVNPPLHGIQIPEADLALS